jgi:amino acid adenylation domain-containing protein
MKPQYQQGSQVIWVEPLAQATQAAVCIHQLFETQVERTPDAIAIQFKDQVLTYKQLNQKANQLAHTLQSLGVGAEVLVGVYLERSLELIVSLLAILKAGGAYVPLDPTYPVDRIAFILSDTQVPVILTHSALADGLGSETAIVVCVDQVSQSNLENPVCRIAPENLMYVIYTSGSTGHPKGVMITHANIHNQLNWRQQTFKLMPCDRLLQTISFSFDPSVWQIFWTLCFGAQLILPTREEQQDSAAWVRAIREQNITSIALVPSMLRVLLEEKGSDRLPTLKQVFCGGEGLPLELQTRFYERLPNAVLYNLYGPTEAAIDATFWTCKPEESGAIAPIGQPITNAQIYILNSDLQPVEEGEAGELHIGGLGLARGYFNRPELTAEKFIPHPFSPDSRLYKSGDLARYLPDGNIEFLGRLDHQVKVRGFRIELSEIENTLNQYFAVKQSLVMAREDSPGDKRLVAYLIPAPGALLMVHDVRQFLKERLPEHMIPSAFLKLSEFPLSPNGKVDRRALPAPVFNRAELINTFIAPQDTVEAQLKEIWEELLKVAPIGTHDNFFDLGGTSILGAQLVSRIEAEFDQSFSLKQLVQLPTIAQLACALREEGWRPQWESLVPIQSKGTQTPLFCVHSLGGDILEYYRLVRYLGDDQPIYGLQIRLLDGTPTPYSSVEEMATAYVQEVRSLQPNGPYCLAGYSFGGLVAYEMARQLREAGCEVKQLILFDAFNKPAGWFRPISRLEKLNVHLKNWLNLSLANKWLYIQKKLMSRVILATGRDAFLHGSDDIEAAHLELSRQYYPLPAVTRMLLFRATQQPYGSWWHWMRTVEAGADLGWNSLVQTLEIQPIECHHFNMLEEPQLQSVAKILKARLKA